MDHAARMLALVRRTYLTIDPRTLALTRIAMALVLLVDLLKRALVLPLFYTNDGLLPNHRMLWRPAKDFTFSWLFAFNTRFEVSCAFGLIALVYVCLLLGYRTRLMHALSWLCLTSLQARTEMLATGADYVLADLVLWTAFLPTGRRFSVDALRVQQSAEPVQSLAVLAALVQLAVIYTFNAISKHGPTWQDGTAVYWLVHQERIVTYLGWLARRHLPLVFFQTLSYSAVVVEALLPLLILSPWGRPWTRRVAIVAIIALHGGMAAAANLGMFSPTMLVYGLLLVETRDWEVVERWWQQRVAQRPIWLRWRTRWLALWASSPARTEAPDARLRWLREVCVAVLMLASTSQTLIENRDLPRALQHRQPRWIFAVVSYFRLNQGWSMFAPDAPQYDDWMLIDAVTVDGRHVDPFNELASRIVDPTLRTIPERLDQDAAYCDYTAQIAGTDLFHEPLRDWIMDYHRRTRRKQDRIVKFKAYAIHQRSPAPGEAAPRDVTARVFLKE